MILAIFDLDNTLLGGDSDYLWGRYLAEQGVVDGEAHERENQRYYDAYRAGSLNIFDFLAFSLRPLAEHPREQMEALRARFVKEKIVPLVLPAGQALIEAHRARGHTPLIITATNRFVTDPIATLLGFEHLIATDPEIVNGGYTGRVAGTPSYREGKVERLLNWTAQHGGDIGSSWFYSDSHNDLPLLERVAHPIAVDADEPLAEKAHAHGWPHITLRAGPLPVPDPLAP